MSPFADCTYSLHRLRRRSGRRRRHRPQAPLLLALAPPGLAGLALLVSACAASPGSHVAQLGPTTITTTQSSPSPDPPATISQSTDSERMLAFARCVREHGVPNYPDPDSAGHLPPGGKEIARSNPQFPTAENACLHLLSSRAGTPQQRQQKLVFALKLAECIRRNGFPTFPDPTASGQGVPPGIDPNSPRFEAAETTCQKRAKQALGLS